MSTTMDAEELRSRRSSRIGGLLSRVGYEVIVAVVVAALFGLIGLTWAVLRADEVVILAPSEAETLFREGERYELTYEGNQDLFVVWEDPAGNFYPRGQATVIEGAASGSLGIIGGCFDFHNGAVFVLRVATIDGQISAEERSYLRMEDLQRLGHFDEEGFESLRNHLQLRAEVSIVRESC